MNKLVRILVVGLAALVFIFIAGIPMAIGILVIPGYWGGIIGGLATLTLIFVLNWGLEKAIGKQTRFNKFFHRFWGWVDKA